jgi:hypothetical protein
MIKIVIAGDLTGGFAMKYGIYNIYLLCIAYYEINHTN